MQNELLRVNNLCFRYNHNEILSDISFNILRGEFVSIVGTNGVGKTILGKVLSGELTCQFGTILYEEELMDDRSYNMLVKNRVIGYIPETGEILENMTVAENLFVGQENSRGCYLNKHGINSLAQSLFNKYSFSINAKHKGSELSEPKKRIIMLIRQLISRPRLLIIDGLMDFISNIDSIGIDKLLHDIINQGTTIIYLTYNCSLAMQYSSRLLFMKSGHIIYEMDRENYDSVKIRKILASLIDDNEIIENKSNNLGSVVLETKALKCNKLNNIDFTLRMGEIVGIVGISSGSVTEFLECISGYRSIESGNIFVDNKKINISNPKSAVSSGIRICGDNFTELLLDFSASIKLNITLSVINRIHKYGNIKDKNEEVLVKEYCKRFGIECDIHRKLNTLNYATLSKVAIASCMISNPKVLILNKVTRGLDEVGMSDLYRILDEVRKSCGVIFNFSKVDKEISMCDRLVFMNEDRILVEMKKDEIDYRTIIYMLTAMKGQEGR